jgi:hypothetical protein
MIEAMGPMRLSSRGMGEILWLVRIVL